MQTPQPFWFICLTFVLLIALVVCLFLLPTTAQPRDGEIGQTVFHFPTR